MPKVKEIYCFSRSFLQTPVIKTIQFVILNDLNLKIIQEHDQPVKTPLGFAPLRRRDGVEPVP